MGALGRGRSTLGRSQASLIAVALGTPAILFAIMFVLAAMDPAVKTLHPERLGLRCFGLTLAAAIFPLVGLSVVRRHSDPVHPAATGAALGTACGASVGVMVEFWCPVATPEHVAIGHILPIVVLSVFGACLGARVLALPRARR
jgi:hypothetical protein